VFAGMTTRAAAAELDRPGIDAPIAARWFAMALSRVRKRMTASVA
jgi:hypothetical protein